MLKQIRLAFVDHDDGNVFLDLEVDKATTVYQVLQLLSQHYNLPHYQNIHQEAQLVREIRCDDGINLEAEEKIVYYKRRQFVRMESSEQVLGGDNEGIVFRYLYFPEKIQNNNDVDNDDRGDGLLQGSPQSEASEGLELYMTQEDPEDTVMEAVEQLQETRRFEEEMQQQDNNLFDNQEEFSIPPTEEILFDYPIPPQNHDNGEQEEEQQQQQQQFIFDNDEQQQLVTAQQQYQFRQDDDLDQQLQTFISDDDEEQEQQLVAAQQQFHQNNDLGPVINDDNNQLILNDGQQENQRPQILNDGQQEGITQTPPQDDAVQQPAAEDRQIQPREPIQRTEIPQRRRKLRVRTQNQQSTTNNRNQHNTQYRERDWADWEVKNLIEGLEVVGVDNNVRYKWKEIGRLFCHTRRNLQIKDKFINMCQQLEGGWTTPGCPPPDLRERFEKYYYNHFRNAQNTD